MAWVSCKAYHACGLLTSAQGPVQQVLYYQPRCCDVVRAFDPLSSCMVWRRCCLRPYQGIIDGYVLLCAVSVQSAMGCSLQSARLTCLRPATVLGLFVVLL